MEGREEGRSLTVGGIRFDLKLTAVIVVTTLLVLIDKYHAVTASFARLGPAFRHFASGMSVYVYDQVLLYLVVPLVLILLLFRESPGRYGVRLGKWREGLVWMGVICPIMALILWFLVPHSNMQQHYSQAFYGGGASSAFSAGAVRPSAGGGQWMMLYFSVMALLPWEFLWRGFYLFSTARVTGPGPAILFQAVPFALLHVGAPEVETMSTIFGGIGFGFIAWRTQSFVYGFLIHVFILVWTNLLASGVL